MKSAFAIAATGFLAFVLLCRTMPGPTKPGPTMPGPTMPSPTMPGHQIPDQPKAPAAKAVECRRPKGHIDIDGVINETAWINADLIELQVPWENRKAKTATKARLLWDTDYLYFCAEMEDADLYADNQNPNGRLWENDVFELFFKPGTKNLAYYEFQVNAANTPLEMFLPSRGGGGYNRFGPLLERFHIESVVKLSGTLNDWTDKDKGWTVEGRISWDAFKPTGGRPRAGDRWRFALCRYDYSVTLEQPERSTSAPLTVADFHRYEDYQELVFVERK
jgi:Carbohydrate family 9 binding domain-like